MSNSLLIPEHPLQVLPTLACKIGFNEALILQQFHYWLQRSNNIKDGHKWIYNSYSKWNKQFPFWSKNTLIRAIDSLEKQNLLITGNYNKAKFDKTKWYRINYDQLEKIENEDMGKPSTHNGQTNNPELVEGNTHNRQTNTNRLPETTTETTTKENMSSSHSTIDRNESIRAVVDYLNQKTGSHFRSSTSKTKRLISARFKEGFNIDDFKKVIDTKVSQWKDDEKMSKYLRPETLFGNKFEGYLNETPKNKAGNQIAGINWKVDW